MFSIITSGSLLSDRHSGGGGPTGLHERDLRSFLLDWHPRTFEGVRPRDLRMPVSLERFLDFPEWTFFGLRCPWAADVLGDRDHIRLRLETAHRGILMNPEVKAWRYPIPGGDRAALPSCPS